MDVSNLHFEICDQMCKWEHNFYKLYSLVSISFFHLWENSSCMVLENYSYYNCSQAYVYRNSINVEPKPKIIKSSSNSKSIEKGGRAVA